MTFHVDETSVRRYEAGQIDRVTAASVEGHLTVCASCRQLLVDDSERNSRSWAGIADIVEPGNQGLIERVLVAVRVPGHVARIIVLSPNMRASFLLAVLLSLIFAIVANGAVSFEDAQRGFLLGAPILPVMGIALAYGRMADPVFELTMSTPLNAFRLLMLRAAAVLMVSMGVSLVAWVLIRTPVAIGATAWLLPSLTLTLATIALASRVDIGVAAGAVVVTWLTFALLVTGAQMPMYGPHATGVHSALIFTAAAAVLARRHRYEREGGRR